MRPSCWRSLNRSWAATRSSRRRSIKHVLEERSGAPQPVFVNRMPYPGAGQRLDRDTDILQRYFRRGERFIWVEGIVGTVNEERSGTRAQLAGQKFGCEQPARKADDPGNRLAAPQPDVEGHHRTLGEPDERQIGVVEPALGQRVVDKCVEERCGRTYAGQDSRRAAILCAEPLETGRRHVAGKRRIGRQKLGGGKQRSPVGRKPDQIVSVRPQPVQQDDETAWPATGGGWPGRSGQSRNHRRASRKPSSSWYRYRRSPPLSSAVERGVTSDPTVTRFAPSSTGYLQLGHYGDGGPLTVLLHASRDPGRDRARWCAARAIRTALSGDMP